MGGPSVGRLAAQGSRFALELQVSQWVGVVCVGRLRVLVCSLLNEYWFQFESKSRYLLLHCRCAYCFVTVIQHWWS
jgi:hypothetical protein